MGGRRGSTEAWPSTPQKLDETLFKIVASRDDGIGSVCPDDEYTFITLDREYSQRSMRQSRDYETTHNKCSILFFFSMREREHRINDLNSGIGIEINILLFRSTVSKLAKREECRSRRRKYPSLRGNDNDLIAVEPQSAGFTTSHKLLSPPWYATAAVCRHRKQYCQQQSSRRFGSHGCHFRT